MEWPTSATGRPAHVSRMQARARRGVDDRVAVDAVPAPHPVLEPEHHQVVAGAPGEGEREWHHPQDGDPAPPDPLTAADRPSVEEQHDSPRVVGDVPAQLGAVAALGSQGIRRGTVGFRVARVPRVARVARVAACHEPQTSVRWKFWKLRLAVGPRCPW